MSSMEGFLVHREKGSESSLRLAGETLFDQSHSRKSDLPLEGQHFPPWLTRGRLLSGLAVALLLGGFVLAYQASKNSYFAYDLTVTRYLQSWQSPALNDILAFFNELANLYPGLAIWLAAFLFLLWRNLRVEAFTLLLAAVPFLGAEALGLLVNRPRPSPDLVSVSQILVGNGFPSGHIVGALVFYGLLIAVAQHHVSRGFLRLSLQAAAASIIPLAGLARIYRGAHWPSDVLGGLLLGGAALAALLWVYARLRAGHLAFLGLEFSVVRRRPGEPEGTK